MTLDTELIIACLEDESKGAVREIVKSMIAIHILKKEKPDTVIGYKDSMVGNEAHRAPITASSIIRKQEENIQAAETRLHAIEEMIVEEKSHIKK